MKVRNSAASSGPVKHLRTLVFDEKRPGFLQLIQCYALGDVDEHTWGGLISTFRDAKGFFGQIDKGIFAATSSGMPPSILYGQQLAELVLGNDSEALGFVRRHSNPGRLLPAPWLGMFVNSGLAVQQIRAWREI